MIRTTLGKAAEEIPGFGEEVEHESLSELCRRGRRHVGVRDHPGGARQADRRREHATSSGAVQAT